MKLSYKFQLAHHPLCDPYKDQRYMIAGIHFCQGCTLVTLGTVIGVIFGMLFSLLFFVLSWYETLGIGVLLLIPAFIVDRQNSSRVQKRIVRFSMGVGIGYGISLVIIHPTVFNFLVFIVAISGLYTLYVLYRKRHPSEDRCITCEFSNKKPYCPGFEFQLEANRKYSEQATIILAPDLERRIEQLRRTTDPYYAVNPKDIREIDEK